MTDLGRKPIAVVKVSGDVLLDRKELKGLVCNVKELVENGWNVVLLHGGSKQTDQLQRKQGLVPKSVQGRRITSKQDLLAVKQAIAGEVNVDLVAALQAEGINAFGCHGASGKLIQAKKRPPRVITNEGATPIDFGEVGDVTSINSKLIQNMLYFNLIPVIATLGISEEGEIFNINADITVVEIARAIQAELLLLTTSVGAIYRDLNDPSSRIKEATRSQVVNLIDNGVIGGDMVPKVEEAMSLLDDSVETIAVVSGREPGAFLDIADDKGRMGTRIIG